MAPIAYFSRRYLSLSPRLQTICSHIDDGSDSLFQVIIGQNAYFEGLYLSSSTIATAMTTLVPAVTFVFATVIGYWVEQFPWAYLKAQIC
ncbi:WAT1-related protein [Trema orientale]|uniref:WAT1-related protein n=1 Tax=Trema orientale TaxID=63057 RepID=A0A2P5FNA5_TREOI|nr:WAT1-related protein [Trema orientale]